MNKSISIGAMKTFPLFWTFKVLFYALRQFFSQDHLISETEFLCVPSQIEKGKDEKLNNIKKEKKERESQPTTLKNI